MKKLFYMVFLTLFVFCSLAFCFYGKGPGTTSAAFLKIPVGARNIAMGETGSTTDDVNAVYWNPAGLAMFLEKQISLMHTSWLQETNYEYLAYAHPLRVQRSQDASLLPLGTVGVGVNYLHMSGIDKYNELDEKLNETYKPEDLAVTVSYARKFSLPTNRALYIGINIKYIWSKLDDKTAYAFATDVGSLYRFTTLPVSIGLVVQNIGTQMKFIEEADPLPLNIKLGCSYNFIASSLHRLITTLDINKPIDNDFRMNFGAEYSRRFGKDFMLLARVGYKTNTKGLRPIDGISSGVGFGFKGYSLDYAFVPYGELDNTHRIALKYMFGN